AAEADASLKLHLPQSILRVHVAKAEERVQLVRRQDVWNAVRVAHDVDWGVEPGDGDGAVDHRQRSTQIEVRAGDENADEQHERRDASDEPTAHGRMIPTSAATRVRIHTQTLKPELDRLYAAFNYPDSATDPIQIVRRFTRSDDREVVGLVAASLAFGRVSSVIQSIERVVELMGARPARYVRNFDPSREAAAFQSIVHRWTRGADLVALLWIMRQMIEASGSIEQFFVDGDDPTAPDVGGAIDSFSSRALAFDLRPAYGRVPRWSASCPGVAYFFPRAASGSGCKRMNLFLRWMIRRDA